MKTECVTRTGAQVNARKTYQTIDGWGLNINSKDWAGGRLAPVVASFVDDLGVTLFRQDMFGRSDWIDPDGSRGAQSLDPASLAEVYAGKDFANGAGMAKWFNTHGIEPYLAVSGHVPKWMCAADGRTLKDLKSWAEMVASFAEWARKRAGIRFQLLGPMNETDIGPPEGPAVNAPTCAKACSVLLDALDRRGLRDIRLLVAEAAGHDPAFLKAFLRDRRLMCRVAAFGMHTYGDNPTGAAVDLVRRSTGWKDVPVWMTEYGDLDQTGEREWAVAWTIYRRLLRLLDEGYSAAFNWDAYDNWHDHDESWSIYGLVRRGIREDTPKKRYWACRQMYRFVRPGWARIETGCEADGIALMAFLSPDGTQITVTGMNDTGRDVSLNVMIEGVDLKAMAPRAAIYRTTAVENCARLGAVPLRTSSWPLWGIEIPASADSIFTATTLG